MNDEDDPESEDMRKEYEFEKRMEQVGHFLIRRHIDVPISPSRGKKEVDNHDQ